MITQASDTNCWVLHIGDADDGTQLHFETDTKAADWATQYGYTGDPAQQLSVPCWLATCSTSDCDGCEGTEDGDPGHIPALKAQHVLAELAVLTLDRGRLLCQDCVEKAKPPAPPTTARPSIVTYDEIGRAFCLLVQLRDQLAHDLALEPADHDVLAKVDSLVGRHPQGTGATVAYVHPFAVQAPLPDMPPISITTAGSLR